MVGPFEEFAASPAGRRLVPALVICLLTILVAQMALSVRRESQTWDEGNHIFAGYMSLKKGDFGLNPEHPPLVKMLAAAPLLFMNLRVPPVRDIRFKNAAFEAGRDFLAWNGPGRVLFPARMSAALLTVALALLIFLMAREMFGTAAGLTALALAAFEPNLLAHGALVTTDAGLSCFLIASVYAFYRYVKAPSLSRLALTGVAAGLTLATKHTGVLVFPMLALISLYEALACRKASAITRAALRYAALLAVIGVVAIVILWGSYGFRYAARPAGLHLNPPLNAEFAGPALMRIVNLRILPESYVYGLADVRRLAAAFPTYLFGRAYPAGVRYYFPAAFAIKSTIAFLVFCVLALWLVLSRRWKITRELAFISIPPALFMLVSIAAKLDIGIRHILPVFGFLAIAAGGVAAHLLAANPSWRYALAGLLLFHAVSSARAFPNYLAYSNEFWGGPANTYKYLSDSNTDWGQELPSVARYLREHGIKQCWFGYSAHGVADIRPYGIPCRELPTVDSLWMGVVDDVPPVIDGPVLVSATALSGYGEPGPLNPYDQFQRLKPSAQIDCGVFVYEGRFEMPLAASMPYEYRAGKLLEMRQAEAALEQAQTAIALCPQCLRAQITLGDVFTALNRHDDARIAYEKALALANELQPGYRQARAEEVRKKLALLNRSGAEPQLGRPAPRRPGSARN